MTPDCGWALCGIIHNVILESESCQSIDQGSSCQKLFVSGKGGYIQGKEEWWWLDVFCHTCSGGYNHISYCKVFSGIGISRNYGLKTARTSFSAPDWTMPPPVSQNECEQYLFYRLFVSRSRRTWWKQPSILLYVELSFCWNPPQGGAFAVPVIVSGF